MLNMTITFSIFVVTLFPKYTYAIEAPKKAPTVCIGESFGKAWDEELHDFLDALFLKTTLQPDIIDTPAKRSEFLFKHRKCDVFFAAPIGFSRLLGREDIFYINESVFRVKLELYTQKLKSPYQHIAKVDFVSQLDLPQTIIAYFSTLTMQHMLSKLKSAKTVPLVDLEAGFEMLNKKRVDYFIFPEIVNRFPDKFESHKKSLSKVSTLFEGDLYIWVSNEYANFKMTLELNLKAVKKDPQWKLLLTQ
ncbi:hypothetical protein [uncultured Paraglaciecola sp.]|uniref:hypothetical protein n=1 Tax=uncultured Paraglaciecola sp. TaxID=1765024 RepID=UPI0025932A43|nr:hypothetical protein [uncultured Paraglaciecola sp.]